MAATSVYNIDYPVNTDLVTNGAAQMQLLAGDVQTALIGQTAALSTGYRNRLRNPYFSQAQRLTTTVGVADSWDYSVDSATGVTWTRNTLGVTAGVPEFVTGSVTNTVASNAGGVARFVTLRQLIPIVRALSGQTVVVSFYAKATAGTPKVAVSLDQYFGTGGAPSATVTGTGQAVTLSTSWTRYALTFTIASASGKTIGTNADDGTYVNLWYSAGANYNTQAASIGLQTSTIDVTGVQLEMSYNTDLERRNPDADWLFSSNFGTWFSFTPTIQQGASPMATTITDARFTIVGKTCYFHMYIAAGAAGTAAANINVNGTGLPAARNTSSVSPCLLRLATTFRSCIANVNTTAPSWNFYLDTGTGNATNTLASGDYFRITGQYEIA